MPQLHHTAKKKKGNTINMFFIDKISQLRNLELYREDTRQRLLCLCIINKLSQHHCQRSLPAPCLLPACSQPLCSHLTVSVRPRLRQLSVYL